MDLTFSGAKLSSNFVFVGRAMRVIPEGQMAPAEPVEPAEPSAPDQNEILEIFKSCFSDETSVGSPLVQT